MITIQVKNIAGKTSLPVAGSEMAAGYDMIAIEDPIIIGESIIQEEEFYPLWKRIDYIEYKTALYISPQSSENTFHNKEYYHTLIHPRSSIRKYNLVLANSIGLIDNDYRGEIICCFKYIWQPTDYVINYLPKKDEKNPSYELLGKVDRGRIYQKGDKIAQLVVSKTNPAEFVLVNELDSTFRGGGGFGSTDKEKTKIIELKRTETTVPELTKNNFISDEKITSGGLVDQYMKAGGISIKKKYSEEVKERTPVDT